MSRKLVSSEFRVSTWFRFGQTSSVYRKCGWLLPDHRDCRDYRRSPRQHIHVTGEFTRAMDRNYEFLVTAPFRDSDITGFDHKKWMVFLTLEDHNFILRKRDTLSELTGNLELRI